MTRLGPAGLVWAPVGPGTGRGQRAAWGHGMAKIEIGQRAPAFTLKDHHGEKLALSSLKGRAVVLYFYPEAMTPACTKQACQFNDARAQFEALGATVVGVSPDTPERLRQFASAQGLGLTLLSDPPPAAARAGLKPAPKVMSKYGAFGQKNMYGRAVTGVIRTTYVIDAAGKVAARFDNVRVADHHKKVIEALRVLAQS